MNRKEALQKLWAWSHWYGPTSPNGERYGPAFLEKGFHSAPKGLMQQSRKTVARLVRTGRCVYCNGPVSPNSAGDHIIPSSLEGSDSAENMAPSCATCNSSKGNRDLLDWWIEHRGRRVEELPLDLLRIYLRLMYQSLLRTNGLSEVAPSSWATAVAQVEATFDSTPYSAGLRRTFANPRLLDF